MYNRYIPKDGAYTRVPVEEPQEGPSAGRGAGDRPERDCPPGTNRPSGGGFPLSDFLTGSGGLTGLLKALRLENLDSGDILLLLIVLLLLLEGDNLELVIALGLVLILGLGDEEELQA